MRTAKRRSLAMVVMLGILVTAALGSASQIPLEEFNLALSAIPLAAHDRILAAIDAELESPGFPAEDVLQLIHRLASIPAPGEGKESILLLLTRAIERNMPIGGLLPICFDLADALEEGLPIDSVVLEALKGMTQGAAIDVIVGGIIQRLTLLREVRDLLFERDIFRASPGAAFVAPSTLTAESFDQLVAEIADAVSDHLSGGGSPFEEDELYELVSDRLRRLAETVVPFEDVDLVLDRIGPPDLTRVALASIR